MKRRPFPSWSVVVLTVAAVHVCAADTLIVHQDGTGDYVTIGAALAAATAGDVIQIGPGTYPEFLEVVIDVGFTSEGGADVTVIDGQNTHPLMYIEGPVTVSLAGLTFTRAYDPGDAHGAAIRAWQGAQVTIDASVFTDNYAGWDNGAVHARHENTHVSITGCTFSGNHANHNGGACGVHTYATMQISGSTFVDNYTSGIAGACNAYDHGMFEIDHCVFVDNHAGTGAIIIENAQTSIVNSTFHNNASPSHSSVLYYAGGTGTFDNNIVTSDVGGGGLECSSTSSVMHDCNLFYGNDDGDVIGLTIAPDEIIADPQFCDYPGGDLHLCVTSPALGNGTTCGIMGAFGVGCDVCGPVATQTQTWGGLKSLYR